MHCMQSFHTNSSFSAKKWFWWCNLISKIALWNPSDFNCFVSLEYSHLLWNEHDGGTIKKDIAIWFCDDEPKKTMNVTDYTAVCGPMSFLACVWDRGKIQCAQRKMQYKRIKYPNRIADSMENNAINKYKVFFLPFQEQQHHQQHEDVSL